MWLFKVNIMQHEGFFFPPLIQCWDRQFSHASLIFKSHRTNPHSCSSAPSNDSAGCSPRRGGRGRFGEAVRGLIIHIIWINSFVLVTGPQQNRMGGNGPSRFPAEDEGGGGVTFVKGIRVSGKLRGSQCNSTHAVSEITHLGDRASELRFCLEWRSRPVTWGCHFKKTETELPWVCHCFLHPLW